jgi:hypothetical protein
MSHPVPWIGLAAIVAMFVLPLLPAWLFEGPRTVKRYPRREVCGDCGERWTEDHSCALEVVAPSPRPPRSPLRGELHRVDRGRALARRSSRMSLIRRF